MVNLHKGKQTQDVCFSFTFYLLILTQLLQKGQILSLLNVGK